MHSPIQLALVALSLGTISLASPMHPTLQARQNNGNPVPFPTFSSNTGRPKPNGKSTGASDRWENLTGNFTPVSPATTKRSTTSFSYDPTESWFPVTTVKTTKVSTRPTSTVATATTSTFASRSTASSSSVKPSSATSSSARPSSTAAPMPDFWIGGNSYYLHAFNARARVGVLDAMQSVGMKTIRIFIADNYANNKGSDCVAVPDLEPRSVGTYDDTILTRIDQLMVEAHARGMKLIIALADRYALGFWSTDRYATTYGIASSGSSGAQRIGDASAFYNSGPAKIAFDKRIDHILNHRNALVNNRKWSDLSDYIYAFEPQNEPMGHMNYISGWNCDRAGRIKENLPAGSPILVTTGGGITIDTSVNQWAEWGCSAIDIISVHDYGTNAQNSVNALVSAQNRAKPLGRQVIFEEWGASGGQKANVIGSFVPALAKAGIPHLVWEIVNPGAGAADFEIWTNEPSWQVFVNNRSINTKRSILPELIEERSVDDEDSRAKRSLLSSSRRHVLKRRAVPLEAGSLSASKRSYTEPTVRDARTHHLAMVQRMEKRV